MRNYKQRGWVIVVSLFITLFIVFGSGYDAAGVFFAPMLMDLSWSRTRLSSLQTALALSAGITAPLTGWLIDRVGAQSVMSVGVALAGIAFLSVARRPSELCSPPISCLVLGYRPQRFYPAQSSSPTGSATGVEWRWVSRCPVHRSGEW
jgi:MFS family permease